MTDAGAKPKKTIIFACGASGGHIFPALAVADELRAQGYECVFAGAGKGFFRAVKAKGYETYHLPASPWNVKNPLRKCQSAANLVVSFMKAIKLLHTRQPSAVFGTGGYATVATVMAARISGVPTVIQDQNVLPGRANRLLAQWVDLVCLAFDSSRVYLKKRANAKVCGNPLRAEVLAAMHQKREEDGTFRVLVMGGSQGARILSDVVPKALPLLENKDHISVIHQARTEDVDRVQRAYAQAGIQAEVKDFYDDMPARMVSAHLVIGRSGASTVCECAALGRAAIFVPLRLADGHQVLNAQVLSNVGAAEVVEQARFNQETLAEVMQSLMKEEGKLARMEEAARTLARPDAAKNVAREVMNLAEEDVMHLARGIELEDDV